MQDIDDIKIPLRAADSVLCAGVLAAMIMAVSFSVLTLHRGPAVRITCDGRINPNIAAAGLLAELPGIGSKKAAAIVDYRQNADDDFKNAADIEKVKGIGKVTAEKMKQFLVFH